MRTVIGRICGGGAKSLRYLLAGILAFALAQTAQAADRTISANYTLTGDETVDGVLTVDSGATVDLNGFHLTVQGLAGDGTITGDPNFVLSDLTSPDTTQTHVTWITKFDTANATAQGNLRNNTTTPRNLFNDATPTVNAGDAGRILVSKGNLPLAVTYDFGDGTPKAVNKYKMYFTRTSYLERGPKTWTFEGSNDNATWTSLNSQDNVTWTSWDATTNPCKEFSFDNDTAYRYYRIVFKDSSDTSASNGGPYLEFNQLEYFDTSAKPELRISVPEGASVTNSTVAISGSVNVVKVGEGEFAEAKAGQAYTGDTVLTEGTYALAGMATLDWSKFTFGTDPSKPVTLNFGATATLANIPTSGNGWELGNVASITSAVHKAGGDWSLPGKFTLGAPDAIACVYHEGGTMTTASRFAIGENGPGYFEISGGTLKTTGGASTTRPLIGVNTEGTMVVKGGGKLVVENNSLFVGVNSGSVGVITVNDGGEVAVDQDLIYDVNDANAAGSVNLNSGGVLSAQRMYRGKDGSATFNFDGGTLVITSNVEENKLFSRTDGSGEVTVTVSANGGTIDNGGNANSSAIGNTITGAGGLTFTGSGTTRIFADQEYLGTTTVSSGTTLSVPGSTSVTFAGPVAFEAGSTLNLAASALGVVPVSASALTLPAEGTVTLTLNGGAFTRGVYAICSAPGVTAADGAKFAPSTGEETTSWSVVGDKLVLTVGTVPGNLWTGLAGDGKMSSNGNWADGTAPTDGEDLDFSGVTASTTIDADIANATFGAVTMGSGAVLFTNDNMRAKSFSDTAKVAVAANSTVTLDGDLVFGTNVESYVCRWINEGGKFVVTGDIIATSAQTGALYPHLANNVPGSISAKGLVNNAASDVFYLVQTTYDRRANWLIGEDGISGSKRYTLGHSGGGRVTIKATADFTVSADIIQYHNLTLIPDGHEITLGADVARHTGGVLGGGYNGANGLTTVTGPGKVVVNYNVTNLTSFAASQINAFTVADGGTLVLVPGANTSVSANANGKLTVNGGATLQVAESGTVTLGGNLTLDSGATLGFNFTERDVAPTLAASSVTASGAVSVKASAADGIWPKGGATPYTLTTGGGFSADGVTVSLDETSKPNWAENVDVNAAGNIVLTVKPLRTMILVK